jgi:hypothetical protein
VKASATLAGFINAFGALVSAGRDKDATWRSLALLCRERGWSKSRAVYELQNGLSYRTFPPGHAIDWHNPNLTHGLNVETGEVVLLRGVLETGAGLGYDAVTVSLEVLLPSDAEMLLPAAAAPWALAKVRTLRAEKKIPDDATKADVARLLEAEAEKDVSARKLRRALKASYFENQLANWGVWPLSSLD